MISRRSLLKGIGAALCAAAVKHWPAPAVPAVVEDTALSILDKMHKAIDRLPTGGRQVFYATPGFVERLKDEVRRLNLTSGDLPGAYKLPSSDWRNDVGQFEGVPIKRIEPQQLREEHRTRAWLVSHPSSIFPDGSAAGLINRERFVWDCGVSEVK